MSPLDSPSPSPEQPWRWLNHERRLVLLALLAGLPGSVFALVLLWRGQYEPKVQWTVTVLVLSVWLGCAAAVRARTVTPLKTLANLLEALREGDYSIRGRRPRSMDALDEVVLEVNSLAEMLRRRRFREVDATRLLEQVLAEIEVIVLTFDDEDRLQRVNRAGERLLGGSAGTLLGRLATDLGVEDCLSGEPVRTLEKAFASRSGRWQLRRARYREQGRVHQLLLLTDLSKALRAEERLAWQRLIRVLSHELNNSLAPIKSTAETLSSLLARQVPLEQWRDDARAGLERIASRCAALNRFLASYAQLARLPAPTMVPVAIGPLVRRVAALEPRRPIQVIEGPELSIQADADQLEQLLINLLKNAVEAAEENDGEVSIRWEYGTSYLQLVVEDGGPGLGDTANLFVPFFTTKPEGTGIGLVLCRQIAEAHGGSLNLEPRNEGGSRAILRLPR